MGAFSASVLAAYERMLNEDRAKKGLAAAPLVDHFDLVTGTSTGGIIAIGLAMGASAETILKLYAESGPKIFPRAGGVAGWLKGPAATLLRDRSHGNGNGNGPPTERFHRLDYLASPHTYALDDIRLVDELIEAGGSAEHGRQAFHQEVDDPVKVVGRE